MTIATYSELVTELGDWLNRADLSTKLPTFIRLFEARINRLLRNPDMERKFTRSTVAGTDTYSLSVRQVRSVYITTSPQTDLTFMSPEALREAYPYNGDARPQAYTIIGESLVLAPTPDAAYTLVYTGYASLTGLDSGNTTNWLLDDHPDAYLFGALAEAYAYLKDEAHAEKYLGLSNLIIDEVRTEANQRRVPSGPLQMQPGVRE